MSYETQRMFFTRVSHTCRSRSRSLRELAADSLAYSQLSEQVIPILFVHLMPYSVCWRMEVLDGFLLME